jgi:hypothetical protein
MHLKADASAGGFGLNKLLPQKLQTKSIHHWQRPQNHRRGTAGAYAELQLVEEAKNQKRSYKAATHSKGTPMDKHAGKYLKVPRQGCITTDKVERSSSPNELSWRPWKGKVWSITEKRGLLVLFQNKTLTTCVTWFYFFCYWAKVNAQDRHTHPYSLNYRLWTLRERLIEY